MSEFSPLLDQVASETTFVEVIKETLTKLFTGGSLLEEMISDDQNRMSNRDQRTRLKWVKNRLSPRKPRPPYTAMTYGNLEAESSSPRILRARKIRYLFQIIFRTTSDLGQAVEYTYAFPSALLCSQATLAA